MTESTVNQRIADLIANCTTMERDDYENEEPWFDMPKFKSEVQELIANLLVEARIDELKNIDCPDSFTKSRLKALQASKGERNE